MTAFPELARIADSLGTVIGDVGRARGIVSDAMSRLFDTFARLRASVEQERRSYEEAVAAIAGDGATSGLALVIRDVLGQFASDVIQVSERSTRILREVESLRMRSGEVADRGQRIEKIAKDTRLIALNARIEGERVGVHGAVFRVVADEIKVLANQAGELSIAIRDAIERQASSLAITATTAQELGATDVDRAVAGRKELDAAVTALGAVSKTSREALEVIQREIDTAIQALQFEDMLTQLLGSVERKLGAIRAACEEVAAGGEGASLERMSDEIHRDAVTQSDVSVGSIELF